MSPKRAKRKAPKRTAGRAKPARARGKVAKKKTAARKPPKRRAVAKRAMPRKKAAARKRPAVKKKAARKPKAAAKKKVAPKTRAAKRATLKLVAKPRPRPARAAKPAPPRPFAGALEGASAKDLAMFDLVRARVEVQAAIQGMQPASANAPVDENRWTPRQIVLHLHYWDREMLPYVERAYLHGERPPHTKDRILAENDSALAELGHHDWDEARRLMQHSRETILEALQSLPEHPPEMWSSEHALGWLIRVLSHHDRHHAAIIKEARSRSVSS